jgi:hypothetical protein
MHKATVTMRYMMKPAHFCQILQIWNTLESTALAVRQSKKLRTRGIKEQMAATTVRELVTPVNFRKFTFNPRGG